VLACIRSIDKVLAKHLLLEARIPTPEFFAFSETAFRQLGAADTLAAAQPTATAPSRTVSLADDGRTIDLVVGERFLLALGDQLDWTVRVADPGVVGRVVNVTVVRGAQGLYEARRPGATALEATGDPPCRRAQPPCGAPSRLFRVQLRVAAGTPLPGLPNTGGGAPGRGRPPGGWLALAGLPPLLGGLWRTRRVRRPGLLTRRSAR
jgi:hypothetical protein